MQTHLEHFRALATKINADAVAYNAARTDLLDRINAAAAVAAQVEQDGGNPETQRAEVRRLKRELAALQAPSFVNPLPDVEQWGRTHTDATAVEPVTVDLPKGQTPLAVHNNLIERTNAIIADLGRRIAAAPAASGDLTKTIEAQIDAIATPPRVVGGALVFPKHVVDSGEQAITVTNVEGLFAWLHRDAMIAAMAADAELDGPGLTDAERGKQLAAAQSKLLTALRAEAAAAMAAEQAGQRVVRRRHVHPAILLGLHVSPVAAWDWLRLKRGA